MTVFLFSGSGGGKTTNALGIALRALGHGQQVTMIQFMKWWKQTGEYNFFTKNKNLQIYQIGRESWWRKDDLNEEDKRIITEFVQRLIEDLLQFPSEAPSPVERCGSFIPNILILDEICLAVAWGLLEINLVKELIKAVPKYITIVMTGRHAPQELIDLADVAVEVRMLKEPEKMVCIKGVNW